MDLTYEMGYAEIQLLPRLAAGSFQLATALQATPHISVE